MILASGSNRVDEKMIAEHIGEKIDKADADFTKEVTGYAIGGIPPIGHKTKILTLIDKDLLEYNELWAAAGMPNAVFSLESKQLVSLTGADVIAIKYNIKKETDQIVCFFNVNIQKINYCHILTAK